jgi:hypothetical protein
MRGGWRHGRAAAAAAAAARSARRRRRRHRCGGGGARARAPRAPLEPPRRAAFRGAGRALRSRSASPDAAAWIVGCPHLHGGTEERIRASVRAVAISPSRSTRSMVPTGKKGRMILMLPRGVGGGWGEESWGRGGPVRGVLRQRAEYTHLLEYRGGQIEASQKNDLAPLYSIPVSISDKNARQDEGDTFNFSTSCTKMFGNPSGNLSHVICPRETLLVIRTSSSPNFLVCRKHKTSHRHGVRKKIRSAQRHRHRR